MKKSQNYKRHGNGYKACGKNYVFTVAAIEFAGNITAQGLDDKHQRQNNAKCFYRKADVLQIGLVGICKSIHGAKNQSQKSSIGTGKTSVNSSTPASFWTDQVDIDDDGTVEDNQFLWDAQRSVLYTYREDDFRCANGNPETGKILMAIYAKGNQAGRPVGSGWYVVGLNAGQCGMAKQGTFGCKFDGSGNYTECGAAVVNDKTGELDVVVAKQ